MFDMVGEGALGALSGAGAGAAMGSIVPGIGTGIGALGGAFLGGVMPFMGDDGQAQQLAQLQAQQNAQQQNNEMQLNSQMLENQHLTQPLMQIGKNYSQIPVDNQSYIGGVVY